MIITKAREQWDRIARFLSFRRQHYCQTFLDTPHGEAVLKDLSKFCRADRTTFDADPRKHAALEGRREVWLRIQQHLNLTPAKLAELYGYPEPNDPKEKP